VQIPVSALARRFGVSRPHVKQVLRSAQENAMMSIGSDGSIKLSPRMIDAAHKLFSTMLAFEWNCGRRALEAANSAAKK
jgi:DNA-binding GntR family transcriptional regulator